MTIKDKNSKKQRKINVQISGPKESNAPIYFDTKKKAEEFIKEFVIQNPSYKYLETL